MSKEFRKGVLLADGKVYYEEDYKGRNDKDLNTYRVCEVEIYPNGGVVFYKYDYGTGMPHMSNPEIVYLNNTELQEEYERCVEEWKNKQKE